MKIGTGKKGAIAEIRAAIWLVEQGFDVYRNVMPNGVFDLIAIRGDEILKVDVTTILCNNAVHRKKQAKVRPHGGNVLYAKDDGFVWDYELSSYELYKKNCVECGCSFETTKSTHTVCGYKCRVERGGRLARERALANYHKNKNGGIKPPPSSVS
jgi:Holliday junction resolvase-like predicted endonuclease